MALSTFNIQLSTIKSFSSSPAAWPSFNFQLSTLNYKERNDTPAAWQKFLIPNS